ncbi:hypothetical protein E2C01_059375 [Portunus trituberculatus]|uniref:Uncharacterized protein n=1 Tax=Portunus trituberculatus TaxID=210409 RepID=A0A5B7H2D2_PORTR|nr:hypothetical protein [Portunus trituberculatus]
MPRRQPHTGPAWVSSLEPRADNRLWLGICGRGCSYYLTKPPFYLAPSLPVVDSESKDEE